MKTRLLGRWTLDNAMFAKKALAPIEMMVLGRSMRVTKLQPLKVLSTIAVMLVGTVMLGSWLPSKARVPIELTDVGMTMPLVRGQAPKTLLAIEVTVVEISILVKLSHR